MLSNYHARICMYMCVCLFSTWSVGQRIHRICRAVRVRNPGPIASYWPPTGRSRDNFIQVGMRITGRTRPSKGPLFEVGILFVTRRAPMFALHAPSSRLFPSALFFFVFFFLALTFYLAFLFVFFVCLSFIMVLSARFCPNLVAGPNTSAAAAAAAAVTAAAGVATIG